MTKPQEVLTPGYDENPSQYNIPQRGEGLPSPEGGDARSGIEEALRMISADLVKMGVVKLEVKSFVGRLSLDEPETEELSDNESKLNIVIKGAINSIDLIGLTFHYSSGAEKAIQISGSNIPESHVSGSASPAEYARRIMEALSKRD